MEMELSHVSVDGSLANPHMRIAVTVLILVVAYLIAAGIGSLLAREHSRFVRVFAAAVLLCVVAPWLQRLLAFIVQSVATRTFVATTFFYPPAPWLVSAVAVPLGVVAGSIAALRRKHAASD